MLTTEINEITIQVDGANKSPENSDNFSLEPWLLNAVTNLAASLFPPSLLMLELIINTLTLCCTHH